MTLSYPSSPWRYPILQLSGFLVLVFLVVSLLTNTLGWFSPPVSVQMMLDLSSSTYDRDFKSGKSLMAAEIEAVKAYAKENALSPNPNNLSLAGFADLVQPITNNFSADSEAIATALEQAVQANIFKQVGGGTNLTLAVESGINSLSSQLERCKEMLVVTDGAANLSPTQILRAQSHRVKLNFLIVSQTIPHNLAQAARDTGGLALSADVQNIQSLITNRLRQKFSSNSKFVKFFLSLALISLMWMLLFPLDRLLQNFLQIRFDHAGRIALFNAVFWTMMTFWWMGLPALQGC
ncbi:vWA domain-containing protein [Pleurocapsa sp. PCC 7319]|uniref:vWA domain-containing protein n=1 Tax=Pleurocapsa sp. PCC 7319 TaxID=118161 RepID=UPI00034C488E|nr:vWA domain-containing protein [Pleurocapsa sp. PCC 7319]